jgi:drug/metabolite transporter (DMT)-like permease
MRNTAIAPYIALLTAGALWGSNPVIGRLLVGQVPPITLSWLRWAIALCLLAPFAWRERREIALAFRGDWKILVLLALCANVPQSALVYAGLETTSAINVGLLNSTIPVLIVALGALFLGRHVTVRQAMGIALSFAGVAAILFRGSFQRVESLSLGRGDLLAFAAMLTWALYTLWLPRRPRLSLLSFVASMSLVGVAVGAPVAAAEVLLRRPPRFEGWSVAALVYISLGPTLAGTLAYSFGAERLGALRAGLFVHFTPLFAAALAIALLGERLHAFHMAGFALVVGGALTALSVPRPVSEVEHKLPNRTHENAPPTANADGDISGDQLAISSAETLRK